MAQEKNRDTFDTRHLSSDLKKRSLRSGAVTVTSQGIMFVIQMGSTMILARILTPQDYGMMAMVVAITGFAGILSNLGLSIATIQRAEINHAQVSTLFWINAGVGAGVTLIVASLSPVVAWFYKVPELVWVMLALSANFFINGLAVQHYALLNRQMRFYSIAKIQVFSTLIGISAAITAALHGFGYWALVINSVTTSFCNVAGAWFALGWVPGPPRRNTDILSMIKFGSDVVGFNIINYFSRNLDNILIGRFHGSSALGLYSKAYQLLMMPITNLRDPLTRVAMPSLSSLQNEPEQYRNYYMKYLSILAFISMPLVAFLYVCSDQIISLLLGSQWMGASELFKILAIAAFIQPVSSTSGLILLSTGKSRKYLLMGLVSAILISTAFVCGLPFGARGVAVAYSIVTYLLLYPVLFYAFKDSPVRMRDFIHAIYKPLVASIVMGIIVGLLLAFITAKPLIVILALCFMLSCAVYLLTLIIISGGMEDIREYFSYFRLILNK